MTIDICLSSKLKAKSSCGIYETFDYMISASLISKSPSWSEDLQDTTRVKFGIKDPTRVSLRIDLTRVIRV